MTRKLSIPHQKVKETYLSLFSNKPIQNKKCDSRGIVESILNFYLLKYENINIDEQKRNGDKYMFVLDRVKYLIQKKRINEQYVPALYYIYKEGNFGCHPENREAADAGEPTYVESLIICLRPIIKDFFQDEKLDTNFLNIDIPTETKELQTKVQKEQSEKENLKIELQKTENVLAKTKKDKRTFTTIFASIFSIALLFSIFYIVDLNKDLDSNQKQINTYIEDGRLLKNKIREKKFKIDSLTTILNTTKQKENINNGIQNEFNDKVDNVTNVGKVDKIEL